MTPVEARRPAIRLFRGRRLEVDVHLSLVVVMALVAVVMATSLLPAEHGEGAYSVNQLWLLGFGCSLLLLLSVAVHEGAHALADLMRGRPVKRISLVFLHSGHAATPEEGVTPWGEAFVAAAGPIATLLLGLLALALQSVTAGPGPGMVQPLLEFLAVANLLLAAVQVVPGHPLDGGRALRAIAWALAGDANTGTRWASRVSLAFAIVVAVACLAAIPFTGPFSLPTWGLLMAIVLGLQSLAIGRVARAKERLTGLAVSHVMQPVPEALPRILAVDDAVASAAAGGESAWLVEWQGRLGGIVTLAALSDVPEPERRQTPVGQVARKLERQHLLDPAMPLEVAFRRMAEEGLPLLPVLSQGNLVGVVRQEAVARMLGGRR